MKRLFIAIACISFAVSSTSCRDTEKEAKTDAEELIQDMKDQGADIKVKDGGDKVKIETNDGDEIKIKTDDEGNVKIKTDDN